MNQRQTVLLFVSSFALSLLLTGCAAHRDVEGPQTVANAGHEESDAGLVSSATAPPEAPDIRFDGQLEFDAALIDTGFPESSATDITDEELAEAEKVEIDPAALAQEALEACESARIFWEQGEIEEALEASEERTRLIVETALDAVVTMDMDGRVTGWNSQAERIFGWQQQDKYFLH